MMMVMMVRDGDDIRYNGDVMVVMVPDGDDIKYMVM